MTWNRIEELGLGLLGLAPAALYSLTFEELGNAVRGKRQSEEIKERSDWERTRWQTALLLNVHTKKGAKITPKDLAVFPWEKAAHKKKPQLDGRRMLESLVKYSK